MDDIMEMAQGKLGRVVALRLRPGTDVLLGLEEACKRAGINNGVILSAVSDAIMSEVRYTVGRMTGAQVKSVDVYVDSMVVD